MSQHVVVLDEKRFVFGWDPALQTFFLQIHDLNKTEDENPIVWLGADPQQKMPGIGVIIEQAREHGYVIPTETRELLYQDKKNNRA